LPGLPRRWGWVPALDHMALVPDVMMGIEAVILAVTRPGDAVVVNPPVYPPFYECIERTGRQVFAVPLTRDYRLDPHALALSFAKVVRGNRRAAFLMCSLHNPTGTVHHLDELRAVAEAADRFGVWVVANEVHAPIVLTGARHVPYLSVPGSERGFSILSASKAFNLAGAKAAVAVAGPAAYTELKRIPAEVSRFGPSHLGIVAHAAALAHSDGWLDSLLMGLDSNCRALRALLAEHLPDIRYRPPEGTYLAWLDCRFMKTSGDPAKRFLERGRVALSSGEPFGAGGAGHVRLNFATSLDVLSEAIRRMAQVS
jgi:cystathionine beta-lyase